MTSIVAAEHLRKNFQGLIAVDDVSFHIAKGECFGMLGPNGAGKTTTIRMLYGFSPRDSGQLRLFGLDVDSDLRQIKGRIGVCQQENTLDPDLSVQQNLEVFARYFSLPKAQARRRAEELLAFTALEHRRQATVSELSGGMLRRLMLARALINHPDLLILDEPTTGLDPQSRQQLWTRLEELKMQGLSILLTTHYMEEAARLCDRLVIMDHGRILVEGAPHALIREHVGHEVIEISHPADALRAFLAERQQPFEDLGHRLLIETDHGRELFALLTDTFHLEGCLLRQASLEDVFLRLTGRELRE